MQWFKSILGKSMMLYDVGSIPIIVNFIAIVLMLNKGYPISVFRIQLLFGVQVSGLYWNMSSNILGVRSCFFEPIQGILHSEMIIYTFLLLHFC